MKKSKVRIISDRGMMIYDRTTSDILKITEDKLRLKLKDFEKSIENKLNIFCYVGIMVTIIVTLLTTNFKYWILTADIWQAIFILGLVILLVLSIKSTLSYYKKRKSINSVIDDIKQNID